MDHTVYLIRVQDGFGWSDYPAIYGDTMTRKESALSLASKLQAEAKGRRVIAVYECKVIEWFNHS